MSLDKYIEKRNFKETTEPKGTINKSNKELIFVVQKHAASRLHYDFRLEIDGVLKSWAVPKGPSLDPETKRLAIMVEDHPFDYKDFEGTIPKGNYGAGTIIVWDHGTYNAINSTNGNDNEILKKELEEGNIKIDLDGEKLKGKFALVKLKGAENNAWLLIKKDDEYATTADILKENKSVLSNVTLESLQKNPDKKNVQKENTIIKVDFIAPMLAATKEQPFDDAEWVFENKYDGYRTVAAINNDEVDLFSRNAISFTSKFKTIAYELQKIAHSAVLDGEVVVENQNGRSDFQMLQNYIKEQTGILKYYVFDIMNLDGNDVTALSLLQRKELLKMLLSKQPLKNIHFSEHTFENGKAQFAKAEKDEAEGIMAKKAESPYSVGQRSDHWLKIKIAQQEEAVIIGFTEPKNGRSYFGALLLAQYHGKELKFIGKCGTGFTEQKLEELYNLFQKNLSEESPFTEKPKIREKIHFIKPKFVAQIKFTEWTQDQHLRHPVYLGLLNDINPSEVLFTSKIKDTTREKVKTQDNYSLKVGKASILLTNQNKIYFPKDGITKGDIVNYYNSVSEFILPYLKNRPQSMNRFPGGIEGNNFYHKDVEVDKMPSYIRTQSVFSESNGSSIDYIICNDKQTLLYMANLGCIDFNPWNSTIKNIENPDWMIIDIDPEKDDFKEVIKVALTVKDVFDELKTACYCKTSGATGMHVYVPLAGKYNYTTVKLFAELIAKEIQSRLPETTTLERSIKKRNHKIYIDYLQNRKGQTIAAPYAVRPKIGATVSTPLEWSEVTPKLLPSDFTIHNVLKRFELKGDLWKPILGKGIDIPKILRIMENQ